jgi:hypothetical protein
MIGHQPSAIEMAVDGGFGDDVGGFGDDGGFGNDGDSFDGEYSQPFISLTVVLT